MANVTITRSKAPTHIRRDHVKPGQVFQMVMANGTLGKKKYACLASNGKFLSMNIASGELASTANAGKKVVIVGTAKLTSRTRPSWNHQATTRGRVPSGQVFTVKGGDRRYFSLGKLGGRFAAIDMAKPLDGDYAVSDDGAKNVTVVADGELQVTLAA